MWVVARGAHVDQKKPRPSGDERGFCCSRLYGIAESLRATLEPRKKPSQVGALVQARPRIIRGVTITIASPHYLFVSPVPNPATPRYRLSIAVRDE